MGDRTVSVIVSCYNYGSYLAGAVESALNQTHRDVEVIIVDDGSTDDTPQVASKFSSDQRVVYVRQDNRGQAAAKNAGVRHSNGPFIAFLDADDRWRLDKLEKQLPLFDDPEVGIVYSRMRPVSADGKPFDERDNASERQPRRGWVSEALFMDNFVPFSSAVVRRRVFEQVGTMDETLTMGIDWDLWLRASTAFRFDFVDHELLDYRVGHPGQMSKRLEERHACADRIMRQFEKNHPNAVRPSVIRRAKSYTLNNRGLYYRASNLKRSTSCYMSSIAERPLQWYAWRGLMGNLGHALGLRKRCYEIAGL